MISNIENEGVNGPFKRALPLHRADFFKESVKYTVAHSYLWRSEILIAYKKPAGLDH
jgi:hypothetical protein